MFNSFFYSRKYTLLPNHSWVVYQSNCRMSCVIKHLSQIIWNIYTIVGYYLSLIQGDFCWCSLCWQKRLFSLEWFLRSQSFFPHWYLYFYQHTCNSQCSPDHQSVPKLQVLYHALWSSCAKLLLVGSKKSEKPRVSYYQILPGVLKAKIMVSRTIKMRRETIWTPSGVYSLTAGHMREMIGWFKIREGRGFHLEHDAGDSHWQEEQPGTWKLHVVLPMITEGKDRWGKERNGFQQILSECLLWILFH